MKTPEDVAGANALPCSSRRNKVDVPKVLVVDCSGRQTIAESLPLTAAIALGKMEVRKMSWRTTITEKSPRLFQNDALELLSRTPPSLVPIIYLPIITYLLWHSVRSAGVGYSLTFALGVAGAASWTIAEYWLHRVPMHWTPKKSWGPKLHFWVHGVHHELPDDPYRLVMPPLVSIALFFIFLGLFQLILGHYTWAFQAGFTFGYVIYDLSHYYFHHMKPRSNWVKSIKRHHMLHHFNPRYQELNFSITVPFWDRVFGTSRPPRNFNA